MEERIDAFGWHAGIRCGHLLLPCAVEETSWSIEKGVTRMWLPYIRSSAELDVEKSINDLCSLLWFLAYIIYSELASR